MNVIRSGPLGWAQHWYWVLDSEPVRGDRAMDAYPRAVEVPPEVTVDQVRLALRSLLERYEALRTTYDQDASGAPRQLVHAECEPQLIILASDGAEPGAPLLDPDSYAVPTAGVFERSSCYAVVGVAGQRVTDLFLVFRQIAVDGVAMETVLGELERQLREPGTPLPVGAGEPQPLDLVAAQSTEEQQKATRRALAYWQQQLRRGPHTSVPYSWPVPEGSVGCETVVLSQTAAALCARIAQATQVTEPGVLHGVLALLICGWTEQDVCAMYSVFSNRWNEVTRRSVDRLAGGGRIVFDLPRDLTVHGFLRCCHLSLLEMYMNASYPVGDLVMRESRESLRQGAKVVPGVLFEYHYANRKPLFADGAVPERITQKRLGRYPPWVFVDASRTDQGLEISVRAPTEALPEASGILWAQAFLRLLERIAEDPETRVGELVADVKIDAPWKQRGWVSLNNAWVHADRIEALLAEHPDVASAQVSTVPGEDRAELVAQVVARTTDLTEQEISEYLRDMATDCPSIVQPHRYVVLYPGTDIPLPIERDPARDERTAWEERPESAEEQALRQAFRNAHPETEPRLSGTYAENSGEFLKVPSLMAELAERGYSGLRHGDFVGSAPLRRLALKMTRTAK
ncbi:condensation domain-containing protein [Sphaerimonospora sp. CA-214678]|uniref:condensation domain-containing protein n=1 Tax=Sphaerimonospora sp. CA-214678 TaxID=3240029 RepID=UPI003D8B34C3